MPHIIICVCSRVVFLIHKAWNNLNVVYLCQANLLCDVILINVSFLIVENIPLLEVPLRRALLVNQKGHKFGIFSIGYEENEDLYKIRSKAT